MNDDQLLTRIVSDPRILAGKPVIKGHTAVIGLHSESSGP